MDQILTSMMEHLNQLHVCGADAERLCAVKQMLRQLQRAWQTAKASPNPTERNEPHE